MPPKDFSQLSDDEARELFERHVAGHPARVEAFRRAAGDDGRLDLSPASLVPAWEWFRRQAGAGDDDGGLPDWYEPDPPELAPRRLSPAALRDVDLLAAYLAEVFLRNVEGLEWALGKLPARMRYVHQNRPVLKRGDLEIEPVSVVYGRAFEYAFRDGAREPDALLRNYRAWVET